MTYWLFNQATKMPDRSGLHAIINMGDVSVDLEGYSTKAVIQIMDKAITGRNSSRLAAKT